MLVAPDPRPASQAIPLSARSGWHYTFTATSRDRMGQNSLAPTRWTI